jgi:hypothetical protein
VGDRLLRRLAEVEEARAALARELAVLGEAVEYNRRSLAQGRAVSEILGAGPGPAARRRVRGAWSRLNRALHAYRTEVIRSLVDDEGWSLTESARLTGNARQVISRLYHGARPAS